MNKRIIFDTSALDKLADDEDLKFIEAGLISGFSVGITMSSLEEIAAATEPPARRGMLLDVCNKRLLPAGTCLQPFNWIIEALLNSHQRNQSRFDWVSLNIALPTAAQRKIFQADFCSDELAAEQKTEGHKRETDFAEVFDEARPAFDKLFKEGKTDRPKSVQELITRLQGSGGAFWKWAQGLYKRGVGAELDEQTIRQFVERCPPFHALILAICVAHYERCIRDLRTSVSFRAGAVDLFSAVYLPYCAQFVTNDKRHLNALREIVTIGDFKTEILSYRGFRERLFVDSLASR